MSRILLNVFALLSGLAVALASMQPVATLDSETSLSGGSDSWAPLISTDGRYVVFASRAANLVNSSSNTISTSHVNVYLRDRLEQSTLLVSVGASGQSGNGDSFPLGVSTNGLRILFESSASNLVSGDTNGTSDIFVRDISAGSTLLVSASTNGAPANNVSRSPVLTPDGHYVAFVSLGDNLVTGDTNGVSDIFLRDLQTQTTVLVSAGAKSAGNVYEATSGSENPQITPDGRFVTFFSTATNLVSGVTNFGDVYVRDVLNATTCWASQNARTTYQSLRGLSGNSLLSYSPVISDDGRYVAFQVSIPLTQITTGLVLRYDSISNVTQVVGTNAFIANQRFGELQNLEITPDGGKILFVANEPGTSSGTTSVYLWDALTQISESISGNVSNAVYVTSMCYAPIFDSTGSNVLFLSSNTNMVTNNLVGQHHLYRRNLDTWELTLLDADANGTGLPLTSLTIPVASADGRLIAFECESDFLPEDQNQVSDVFVRDLFTGVNELISKRATELPSITPNGRSQFSRFSVNSTGDYIAFESDANDLTSSDTNAVRDIFFRDRVAGTNLLVSANTNSVSGNRTSTEPSISGEGRFVAFTSSASDLVSGDTNGVEDIFVRDMQNGTTTAASRDSSGTGFGNKISYAPVISEDGKFVAFRSASTNLTTNNFSGTENLFVRDLQNGTNFALTTSATNLFGPVRDQTGRYFAFGASGTGLRFWSVWDSQSKQTVVSNSVAGNITAISLSPDGAFAAFSTDNRSVLIANLSSNTVSTVSTNLTGSHPGLRFSGDDRWLVYTKMINNTNQVYLYDSLNITNILISRSFEDGSPAGASSDSPDISPDGRFIVYRSYADNIVPGDTNGAADIFVYDRISQTTTLLTGNYNGTASANQSSLHPAFTDDGRTIVFQTWASDLIPQNFHETENILAYQIEFSGPTPSFSAQVLNASHKTKVIWPVAPGYAYRVQFKNNVNDLQWQNCPGGTAVLNGQGYFTENSDSNTHRFYRVVATSLEE